MPGYSEAELASHARDTATPSDAERAHALEVRMDALAKRAMEPRAPDGNFDIGSPIEHILQFFGYAHLPYHLQAVSRPFSEMASRIIATLPDNRERLKALDKLLESKDSAVRALVAK